MAGLVVIRCLCLQCLEMAWAPLLVGYGATTWAGFLRLLGWLGGSLPAATGLPLPPFPPRLRGSIHVDPTWGRGDIKGSFLGAVDRTTFLIMMLRASHSQIYPKLQNFRTYKNKARKSSYFTHLIRKNKILDLLLSGPWIS